MSLVGVGDTPTLPSERRDAPVNPAFIFLRPTLNDPVKAAKHFDYLRLFYRFGYDHPNGTSRLLKQNRLFVHTLLVIRVLISAHAGSIQPFMMQKFPAKPRQKAFNLPRGNTVENIMI